MDKIRDRGPSGKLRAAARHWVTGRSGGGDDTVAEDLKVMGAPQEIIDEYNQADHENMDTFLVWPGNWEAVMLFLSCNTQWRFSPSDRLYGMDYTSVESVMRIRRIKPADRSAMLDDLRVMESAALEAMHE